MATSGGQVGNNNGGKNKPWADAIRAVLVKYESPEHAIERGYALEKIAYGLVEMAIERDPFAIQEIANRLDGKPRQEVDATVDGSLTVIIREFVLPGANAKLVQHEPELIEHGPALGD